MVAQRSTRVFIDAMQAPPPLPLTHPKGTLHTNRTQAHGYPFPLHSCDFVVDACARVFAFPFVRLSPSLGARIALRANERKENMVGRSRMGSEGKTRQAILLCTPCTFLPMLRARSWDKQGVGPKSGGLGHWEKGEDPKKGFACQTAQETSRSLSLQPALARGSPPSNNAKTTGHVLPTCAQTTFRTMPCTDRLRFSSMGMWPSLSPLPPPRSLTLNASWLAKSHHPLSCGDGTGKRVALRLSSAQPTRCTKVPTPYTLLLPQTGRADGDLPVFLVVPAPAPFPSPPTRRTRTPPASSAHHHHGP